MRARLPLTAAATAAALALASAASAQTDWHIYGGGVLGGEEHTRGALFGIGSSAGDIFFAGEGHGLWLTDEGHDIVRAAARGTGLDFTYSIYGADLLVGGVVRSSTGRVDFIPVGIIGYTTAEVEGCIGSLCDDESESVVNFGAGANVAMKGESGRGLHLGFRYTRNYGAALTVGFVFQTGGQP